MSEEEPTPTDETPDESESVEETSDESAEEKELESEEKKLEREASLARKARLAAFLPGVGTAIGATAAAANERFKEQLEQNRELRAQKKQEREQKAARQAALKQSNTNSSPISTTYNQESTSGSAWHTLFVCFIALIIHGIDVVFFKFNRSINATAVMFLLYMIFAFYIVFAYYKTGFSQESGKYFGISAFAWLLPYLLWIPILGERLRNMQFAAGVDMGTAPIVVIFTLIPIWFYYIIMREKEPTWLYRIAYVFLFILAFFIFMLLLTRIAMLLPGVGDQVGANVAGAFTSFGSAISNMWDSMKGVFSKAGLFNADSWRSRINQTFNPRLAIYQGQVEENQEPQGVFITNVQSLYPQTPIGTDPVIFGRVETRTFLDQVTKVIPSCSIERGTTFLSYTKQIEPPEPFDIQQNLIRDVTCTYHFEDDIKPGTYYGVLGASFDFETWSYVTYTFVGRDLILQYLRNNRDIHRDLDIPTTARAVYTNGPVEIGMIALQQPIDIDPNDRNNDFIKQNFGFTIKNRWTQGKIGRVYEVNALMPEQFTIENCKPNDPSRERVVDGMRNYTWNANDLQIDPVLDLSTVTCRLKLPNQDAANKILSFGEKTPATFVVMAKYNYITESRVPVRIVE